MTGRGLFVGIAGLLLFLADITQREYAALVVCLVLSGASVFWLGREPGELSDVAARRRLGRMVGRLAVGFAAALIAIAVVEGIARWMYRDVTTTATFRGYFTVKWLRDAVRHNHYGFRDAEFEERKPDGIYRIAVIGDSFTYGNGVPEDRRFSDLLHARLRDRGVEVLNFGFPGNNWPEHVATLERRILRLAPDFILLQWGINDVELDADVSSRPRLPALVPVAGVHEWLHLHSAVYTLLNARWTVFQVLRRMGDPYPEYMRRLYGDAASEGAQAEAERFARFVALARSRGGAVGVLLFPDLAVDLGSDYPYQFLHDRMQARCAQHGVTCLDLRPSLARAGAARELWASPLDSHPGMHANAIAADELQRVFGSAWPAAK